MTRKMSKHQLTEQELLDEDIFFRNDVVGRGAPISLELRNKGSRYVVLCRVTWMHIPKKETLSIDLSLDTEYKAVQRLFLQGDVWKLK